MEYMTVRELAKLPECPINERVLRKLVKSGKIRSFSVGTRTYLTLEDVRNGLEKLKDGFQV